MSQQQFWWWKRTCGVDHRYAVLIKETPSLEGTIRWDGPYASVSEAAMHKMDGEEKGVLWLSELVTEAPAAVKPEPQVDAEPKSAEPEHKPAAKRRVKAPERDPDDEFLRALTEV